MEKISAEEVTRILGNRTSRNEFAAQVQELKKGEALKISISEWKKKTSIPLYFSGAFNKKGKVVSCRKVNADYYIIKL